MSNIVTAGVAIRGVRPLLWHKFGPDALPLEKQERTGVAGNDPEEWHKTVSYTREGQLYVEPSYFFGCIRDAARMGDYKIGRKSAMSFVAATLQILDDRVLVDRWIPGFNGGLPETLPDDPDEPVYLDVRGVRNPSTRARNVRYRVAANVGWRCQFQMMWDVTVVDRNLMEAIAIDAGRLVGVGDGRSIGFGRFEVEAFEVVE